MSTSQPDDALSPEAEARLSEMLESWAATRRLTAAQSSLVLEAVLEGRLIGPVGTSRRPAAPRSGELGCDWWHILMNQVASIVVAARGNGDTPAGLSAVAWGLWQSAKGSAEPTSPPGGYRLYLRLSPVPLAESG